MLFLFYTNTIFSKFKKLNTSTSLPVLTSGTNDNVVITVFEGKKTCVKAIMIISDLAKHFFFFFFVWGML